MVKNSDSQFLVMVVDDEKDIREMLIVVLYAHGCRVLEAENGREAVEIARRECPDMIFMDLSMPLLDGFAAAEQIREIKETRDVPIVACSAHDTYAYRIRALAVGFNEYLTKPIDFVRLQNLVHRFLIAA